jgi:murein DD-endopeptidase MepM/ murein hydrolase activator NlpD
MALSMGGLGCGFAPPSSEAPAQLADDTDDAGGASDDDDDGASDGGSRPGGTGSASDDAASFDDSGPGPGDDETTGGVANDCPRARVLVSAGNSLNVRPTPSTAMESVGSLPNHSIVDVLEVVTGESIDGNDQWFWIATAELEGYIFGAFAECTFDEPPDLQPPTGWWLPLECGDSATISQGNFGDFSHQGNAAYAFDFSLGIGTPMAAMADGIVIFTYTDTMPGDPCYDGGDSSCFPYANLVTLLHGDGTTSIYKHLSDVWVSDGEFVPRGTVVGLSGSTGYSTGPHAHVMRQEDCGMANCQSVPLEFVDVPGGVPTTGQTVTSDNCP